ncbi:alpha/beta hydrolase [Streptomyces collinus]|uniref:alpha/beta hydrolase n=1 Tax=Streptomyces collinus TaxID=42684 RepID=UPI0036B0CE15
MGHQDQRGRRGSGSNRPWRADRRSAAPPGRPRSPDDPGAQRAARPRHRLLVGVSVARQLGRSGVLLTYEGHGHGSVTSGPCVENAVDGYRTDPALPPRGSSCPAADSVNAAGSPPRRLP